MRCENGTSRDSNYCYKIGRGDKITIVVRVAIFPFDLRESIEEISVQLKFDLNRQSLSSRVSYLNVARNGVDLGKIEEKHY